MKSETTGAHQAQAHSAPLRSLRLPTGWRKEEILGLTWDRVDFDEGWVRLEPGTTKNRKGRAFPFVILPALRDLLVAQRRDTDVL